MIHSYKDLTVWQRSIELVVAVYELTEFFPREEVYGLTAQMRRSAVSIPSNIAEGRFRGTKKDYLQFLRISYASGAELETQIEIAKRLSKTQKHNFGKVDSLLLEVMKMLNTMIRSFNPNKLNS
jgi:four helix bundle protein